MKPCALVVDDSLTVRMDVGDALEAAGFDVALCEDLKKARQALAERAFFGARAVAGVQRQPIDGEFDSGHGLGCPLATVRIRHGMIEMRLVGATGFEPATP